MPTISGTVLDDAGDPAAGRVVRAYRRDTGALLAETVTDAGAYEIDTAYEDEVNVVCLDNSGGTTYNDLILRTTPALPPGNYISTPAETPPAFGDAFEGGFYMGMIWNETTTSSTSTTLATGPLTIVTSTDMAVTPLYYVGQSLEVRSRANPSNRFQGTVTFAGGATLTLDVTSITGSGTFSDWSIMSRYRVIIAPKASGVTTVVLKNAYSALPAACRTLNEGFRATQAMFEADTSTVYPGAHWARGLSIGGYTDWYIPARDELELGYRNLKPVTGTNNHLTRPNAQLYSYAQDGAFGDTSTANGVANNTDPQYPVYTASEPAQTASLPFREGGAETIGTGTFRSCSEYNNNGAWAVWITPLDRGYWDAMGKAAPGATFRAVRRSII
jgi:hypothetical protein